MVTLVSRVYQHIQIYTQTIPLTLRPFSRQEQVTRYTRPQFLHTHKIDDWKSVRSLLCPLQVKVPPKHCDVSLTMS